MKKYLLTVVGGFNLEETKIIASSLELVVDSPHLKFFQTNNVIIFHFGSEIEKIELYDYLSVSFNGMVDTFILSYFDDNMTCIPEEAKSHLFDLEQDNNSDIKFAYKNNKEINEEEDDYEDEDFVALLLEDVKKRVKKPSLDQILDKIKKTGLNSLTQFEKDTLEDYSKN